MVTAMELKYYSENADLRESEMAYQEFMYAINEHAYVESMIENKLKLNLQAVNMKVINESGSMDDVVMLTNAALSEAADQNNANNESLWQKFKNFLTRLWNAVQKIFTGNDTEAYKKLVAANNKVRIPVIIDDTINTLTEASNKIKVTGKGIAAALASIAGLTAGGVAIKNAIESLKGKDNGETKEVPAAEADKKLNILKSLHDKFFGLLGKNPEEIPDQKPADVDDSKLSESSGIVATVTGWIENLMSKIKSAVMKSGSGNDQNGNTNGGTDNTGDANGQNGNGQVGATNQEKQKKGRRKPKTNGNTNGNVNTTGNNNGNANGTNNGNVNTNGNNNGNTNGNQQ